MNTYILIELCPQINKTIEPLLLNQTTFFVISLFEAFKNDSNKEIEKNKRYNYHERYKVDGASSEGSTACRLLTIFNILIIIEIFFAALK